MKLERVGQRIHRIVENYFGEIPFLRLNLLLEPRFSIFTILFSHFCDNLLCYRHFGHGLSACIEDKDIEPSHLDANSFPSFFRFGNVDIFISRRRRFYEENLETQPLAEKCQLFEDQLKLIKPALNGSIMNFDFIIDQSEPSCFCDHSKVLEYLRNRMLPICAKSRRFEFWISDSDADETTTKSIVSILQMDEVKSCSNISIIFLFAGRTKLPIKEISNWLHRSCDVGGQRERSLLIHLDEIESIVEVFVHLKEVFILYFRKY